MLMHMAVDGGHMLVRVIIRAMVACERVLLLRYQVLANEVAMTAKR